MDLGAKSFTPESLTALTEASAAINSTLELDEVLSQIVLSAARVMCAEASSVLLWDRHRNKLQFAAAVGQRGEQLIGKEFDAELGIAGQVLRTGEADRIDDASADPHHYSGIDDESSFQTHGLIAAPMVFRRNRLGVVEVLNRADGGPFSDHDLELLKTFANLAASGVHNAQAHDRLRKENLALRDSVLSGTSMIGRSERFRQMVRLAERVAPTNTTVLLLGETGTGKEVLAKHIHSASQRREKAFVAVNCAALTETLLESELFGHEKGAFTGAIAQHIGRFELADGGTLLLDEIGDISPSTQVKLLRLLQERAFTRVGGTRTISCDVRIIAATNRDLKQAISQGRFREDLYYRLNVFPVMLPPLRERRDDIPPLIEHFAKLASTNLGVALRVPSEDALGVLRAYDWPGNIRELANVVERAVLMADGPVLLTDHLPPEFSGRAGQQAAGAMGSLRETEREMIVRALRDNHWNQSKTARALGISRDNLRYRIKKYGITREST